MARIFATCYTQSTTDPNGAEIGGGAVRIWPRASGRCGSAGVRSAVALAFCYACSRGGWEASFALIWTTDVFELKKKPFHTDMRQRMRAVRSAAKCGDLPPI